jgi:hypothetical protein
MRSHSPGSFIMCWIMVVMCFSGCGGGGSRSASITIHWGARSREIDGPSSAQSAVIFMKGAGQNGGDLTFTVNRDSILGQHFQSYETPIGVPPGTYLFTVAFPALANGVGTVMGSAAGTISVNNNGGGNANVETIGTVSSVQIPAGQSVRIGGPADIIVSVLGGDPVQYLGVTYGAIFYEVVDGKDKITVESGRLLGISPGIATVSATVDGVASLPVSVSVLPP